MQNCEDFRDFFWILGKLRNLPKYFLIKKRCSAVRILGIFLEVFVSRHNFWPRRYDVITARGEKACEVIGVG